MRGASALLLTSALVLLPGCGYRFAAGGAPLPVGADRVFSPLFRNHTSEPSLEVTFTQAMRERLGRAGVEGGSASDSRIEGEILRLGSGTGFAAGATPVYRLDARLRLRLVKSGTVVAQTEFSGTEDYLSAAGDILGTEANRQAALRRLAQSMVRDGYEQLAAGY